VPVILANITAEDSMPPLPEGLLIELVTPLNPDGSLDQESLGRLSRHVAPWAAALIAGSPGIGEALELPPSLRVDLLAAWLDLLPPSLPLLFGITSNTPQETRELVQQLETTVNRQASRPVFWLDLPLWWHSNRGLPQAYEELRSSWQRPVILMNHPHLIRGKGQPLKHVNIRTAVLKKLVRLQDIAGLIYHGELRRFLHYYAAAAARPEFMVYEADEKRFLTQPGARGLVSAGAQLVPQLWQEVTRACLFPSFELAQAKPPQRLWEQSQQLVSMQELYQLQPAALLKQGLQHLGIIAHGAICPQTPAAPAHLQDRLIQLLERLQKGGDH